MNTEFALALKQEIRKHQNYSLLAAVILTLIRLEPEDTQTKKDGPWLRKYSHPSVPGWDIEYAWADLCPFTQLTPAELRFEGVLMASCAIGRDHSRWCALDYCSNIDPYVFSIDLTVKDPGWGGYEDDCPNGHS